MKRTIAVACIAALAACSGHSGGSSVVPRAAGTQAPLTFSISVPVASGVRPQRVSSSALGVGVTTYAHSDTAHATPIGYFGNDISASSPQCAISGAFRVCTIHAAAPAGVDDLVVTTYDAVPNGGGTFPTAHALDTGTVTMSVVAGTANSAGVTLGGIPAAITVSIDNPYALYDTHLYGAMPYTVEVSAQDASGATIIGSDPYAAPIALSSTSGSASFAVNGTAATAVAAPTDRVTLSDANAAAGTYTLTASSTGATSGTSDYALLPQGSTTALAANTSPGAIAAGSDGNMYYADASAEIVSIDPATGAQQADSLGGQVPAALAVTSLATFPVVGIDVAFVTASDGTGVWPGSLSGGTPTFGMFSASAANCNTTVSSALVQYLACADQLIDANGGSASTFPGRAFGEIAIGPDGNLWYAYDVSGQGWLGTMAPSALGGSTDATYELAAGYYANQIAVCPNGKVYVLEEYTLSPAGSALGEFDTSGASTLYAFPATVASIACGPDNSVWAGGFLGALYRYDATTHAVTTVSLPGGVIAALALGPDGKMWATDQSGSRILTIVP